MGDMEQQSPVGRPSAPEFAVASDGPALDDLAGVDLADAGRFLAQHARSKRRPGCRSGRLPKRLNGAVV